jgi:hypothetical protein
MSTCQTHLFPCQCFDQYWFELQLNWYSIYSLLLCFVSVCLYIEFMPATVILKLCLTFVFVAALVYRWIGRAGILLEFIFTRVWGFDGLNALLGLFFTTILLYILHVFLFLMHLIIWRNCSKLQAVVYRHAVVELLHTNSVASQSAYGLYRRSNRRRSAK